MASSGMFTVKEAAAHARVSASLIYAWCKAGMLKHVRFGRPGRRGTIRINGGEFESFLQTMQATGDPPAGGGRADRAPGARCFRIAFR